MSIFLVETASAATYNSPLVVTSGGYYFVGQPFNAISMAYGQSTGPVLSSTVPVSLAFLNLTVFGVAGSTITQLFMSTNTVTPYSTSTGIAPSTCFLACNWRGRLCLAGDFQNPQNFYMARVGNPYDWNYAALDPAAAVAGNLSNAGQIGEPIMALMPYTDDIMLMGCINSLWMLSGDPADGGTIVRVSDQMGILGPYAWTVDPQGYIYFLARGGLYRVQPVWELYRPPELLSGNNYDQFFTSLTQTENYFSLVWDIDHKYLHIFVTPTSSTQTGTHLIYDTRNQGLWPQQYPTSAGPTAAGKYTANTTAGGSMVILGGWDGYLRQWTPSTLADDGSTISSHITFGPFQAGPDANILTGATLDFGEIYSTDTISQWNASTIFMTGATAYDVTQGTPRLSTTLPITLDRRQKNFRQRLRGGWHSMQIANNTPSTYFSFESGKLEFDQSGRNRDLR